MWFPMHFPHPFLPVRALYKPYCLSGTCGTESFVWRASMLHVLRHLLGDFWRRRDHVSACRGTGTYVHPTYSAVVQCELCIIWLIWYPIFLPTWLSVTLEYYFYSAARRGVKWRGWCGPPAWSHINHSSNVGMSFQFFSLPLYFFSCQSEKITCWDWHSPHTLPFISALLFLWVFLP